MSRTLVAPKVRPLTAQDRDRVEGITRNAPGFRSEEVAVALEVFDAGMGIGRSQDPAYELAGAELEGEGGGGGVLAGWACWGPTPCTEGTFDLYWIVVDREWQGRGIGTALVEAMERSLVGRGRMIVVETAGRPDYGATRAFYQRRGYHVGARIQDYYAPGDDLVTYVKKVQ